MAISLWFVKNQDSIKPWTTVVLVVAQCLLYYIYAHKWGPLLEKKAGKRPWIPPTWPWKRIFVVSSIKLELRIPIKRFNSQWQRISPEHFTLRTVYEGTPTILGSQLSDFKMDFGPKHAFVTFFWVNLLTFSQVSRAPKMASCHQNGRSWPSLGLSGGSG